MGRQAGIPAETLLGLRRRLTSLPIRAPERRLKVERVAELFSVVDDRPRIGGPGPFSDGDNEAWSGMLQEEYGRLISRSGGIGVADSLMREMLKMQESG